MNSEFPLSWPPGFPHIEYPAQSRSDTPEERVRRIWSSRYLMDAMNVVVSTKLRAAPPRPAVFQPEHHGLGCGGLFTTERPQAGHRLRQMGLYPRQPPSRSQDRRSLRGIKRLGDGVMVNRSKASRHPSATCQNNHPAPVDAASEPSGATQHQHPNRL